MSDWRVWLLGITTVSALALSIYNIRLHERNRAVQAQVTERQQRINEGVRLSQFNTQFITTLATMAANKGDAAISQLLARHGISFTVNAPAEATEAAVAGDEQ